MEGLFFNISDHELGIKRKVEIRGYIHLWSEQIIKVFTMCHHYENDNGNYGEIINTQAIKSFERILSASNIRQVEASTGIQVLPFVESGETIYRRVNNNAIVLTENVIGQFDFYDQTVKNNQVNIPNLLENVIITEDLIYKSYDK